MSRPGTTLQTAVPFACALLGCTPEPAPAPVVPPASVSEEPVVPPAPPPPVQLTDVVVDVVELDALKALEADGWSFADALARQHGGPARTDGPHPNLAALYTTDPLWHALADHLSSDIDALNDGIHRDLVTELEEAKQYPAGNVGRRLDTRWFRSSDAHLRLVGVVQRIDRRDLHREPTCGEVRFLYRLAYAVETDDGGNVGSRLPLHFNLVYVPKETDCTRWARAWAAPPSPSGVLSPEALTFDRLELNLQVVRFPAGFETEFGGQAAYLLEVVDLDMDGGEGRVTRQPLENTPDVTRLRADPELRDGLTAWVAENVSDIDQGTYRIPDRFLADRALSWSTLGVNRLVNRPFSALYPLQDRAGLPNPSGKLQQVASVDGLLDRLDNGSCTGCHQAGSAAGFHLPGPDDPELAGVTNRLAQVFSPHLAEERLRRRAKTRDLANGKEPDRFRDHSLAPNFAMKGYIDVAANQPCLPEGQSRALQPRAQWRCSQATGPTECTVVASDSTAAIQWGQCTPKSVDGLRAGMACRTADITSRVLDKRHINPVWGQHGYADKVAQQQRFDLPEDKTFSADRHNCRPPLLGVPLGRAYRSCTAEERALTAVKSPGTGLSPEICGVVGGSKFDKCVENDFHGCMEDIVGRGMVASCDAETPCREDHVCQALPYQLSGVPEEAGRVLSDDGVGFCTPTYFLFQLRIDGHPVPTVAASKG